MGKINFSQELNVIEETEVAVVGGGPSGFVAAIAAARNGAKTVLIEKYGFLGGMATAGLVGPISKFKLHGQTIVGGIPFEFVKKMADRKAANLDLENGSVPFDAEMYKYTAMQMVDDAKVQMLFHSRVIDCIPDKANESRISHIVISGPSGLYAIKCQYLIDCTGTGDVVSKTKLHCQLRENAESLQPMSLMFRLGGVKQDFLQVLASKEKTRYSNAPLREILQKQVDKGNLKLFGGPWAFHGSTLRDGEVTVNATRCGGNPIDVHDITKAEILLRNETMVIVEAFKESPAFKDAYLIETAAQVGVREARTIEGLYTVDQDDILNPKDFPDTVAKGGHPMDMHLSSSSGQKVTFLDKPYTIPFRSLVPKNSVNLLVAGNLASATKEAFSTIRVQAQCMALGQAAGTAAALGCSQKLSACQIDGEKIREIIAQQGAIV